MTGGDFLRGIVHVVDDDRAMRKALGQLLDVAGHAPRLHASAQEYLHAADEAGPACVLLDLRMPGTSGLELQRMLRSRRNAHPVIFLSGHGDIPATVRAIQDGAVDFLTKPVDASKLLDTVQKALERDVGQSARRAHLASVRARYETLTAREREVMAGVIAGLLNKQICYALDAAERTVKTHRARVMAKMDARSVPALVQLANDLREDGVRLADPPPV